VVFLIYLFSILCSAALILFLFCPAYILLKEQRGKTKAVVALKALSTAVAVCFALYGTIKDPTHENILILCGLICGLLGDILLEYIVPLGGLSFGIGNLIYVYHLVRHTSVHWYHLVLLALFLLLAIRTFAKDFDHFGPYRLLYIPYGFVVAVMASLSVSYMVSNNPCITLFGFGAFLFAISDFLLAYRTLYAQKQSYHTTSLGVYYMAQFCIGISVFLST